MTDKQPTYKFSPGFDKKIDEFVKKFIEDGFLKFKDEFKNIDHFVNEAVCDQSDRSDKRLRQSPKEKYLLELVSFKIYDELNREEFNSRKQTLIIMPDCLSIHEKECEKIEHNFGNICKKCQKGCQAYQIVELAKKYGVKVLFSKRKLTEQLKHHADKMGDMAVIGIACLMMLAEGMRSAFDIGIPARGVLLNFTGCDHWNDNEFASEFNLNLLENILREKYGERN